MVPGSGRENTIVVGACSASGIKLLPLIIFQGQQVQSTRRPTMPANAPNYTWIYANKTGWMDSEVFFKWCEQFEKTTQTYKKVIS